MITNDKCDCYAKLDSKKTICIALTSKNCDNCPFFVTTEEANKRKGKSINRLLKLNKYDYYKEKYGL